jgi:hypothetical protein
MSGTVHTTQLRDRTNISGTPNFGLAADLAIFAGIWTYCSRRLVLNARPSSVSRWHWWWLRPQFRNEPQNLLEHLSRDRNLGHLEGNTAAVAHDLRADLDELLLQARQRPILDRLRRRQRAQEIAEIVGERVSDIVQVLEAWEAAD